TRQAFAVRGKSRQGYVGQAAPDLLYSKRGRAEREAGGVADKPHGPERISENGVVQRALKPGAAERDQERGDEGRLGREAPGITAVGGDRRTRRREPNTYEEG